MATKWSYSGIKTFEQCPKKYYHTKVAKDFVDAPGVEAQYGTDFHTAAELFVRDGTPLPGKFVSMQPILDKLKALPGEKYCELKFGLKKTEDGKYAPTGFFDDDVWMRGIADLLVINGTEGWLTDYKTGKSARYADARQLDLMAGAAFTYFPQLETLRSSLIFVVSGEIVKAKHFWESTDKYLATFDQQLADLDKAQETDQWAAKSSGLCPWCPVVSCEHWRERPFRR